MNAWFTCRWIGSDAGNDTAAPAILWLLIDFHCILRSPWLDTDPLRRTTENIPIAEDARQCNPACVTRLGLNRAKDPHAALEHIASYGSPNSEVGTLYHPSPSLHSRRRAATSPQANLSCQYLVQPMVSIVRNGHAESNNTTVQQMSSFDGGQCLLKHQNNIADDKTCLYGLN